MLPRRLKNPWALPSVASTSPKVLGGEVYSLHSSPPAGLVTGATVDQWKSRNVYHVAFFNQNRGQLIRK